jgi:hypothetical protein
VSINIISIIIIIIVHHLFCKGPRPLVTVSTAVITVLHSAEVVHFYCESWFTLSPEVANLLTHFQGRLAGFTMKSFKGSSNKLGSLGFISQFVWYNHAGIHSLLFPICATRVTSNKLEKGPSIWLKLEPCSPHSCTVSPGCSLTDEFLWRETRAP